LLLVVSVAACSLLATTTNIATWSLTNCTVCTSLVEISILPTTAQSHATQRRGSTDRRVRIPLATPGGIHDDKKEKEKKKRSQIERVTQRAKPAR
jgi:hypothetical protein